MCRLLAEAIASSIESYTKNIKFNIYTSREKEIKRTTSPIVTAVLHASSSSSGKVLHTHSTSESVICACAAFHIFSPFLVPSVLEMEPEPAVVVILPEGHIPPCTRAISKINPRGIAVYPFVVNVNSRKLSSPGFVAMALTQGKSLFGPIVSMDDVRTVRVLSVGRHNC